MEGMAQFDDFLNQVFMKKIKVMMVIYQVGTIVFSQDPKFSLRNSLVRVFTVCNTICNFLDKTLLCELNSKYQGHPKL